MARTPSLACDALWVWLARKRPLSTDDWASRESTEHCSKTPSRANTRDRQAPPHLCHQAPPPMARSLPGASPSPRPDLLLPHKGPDLPKPRRPGSACPGALPPSRARACPQISAQCQVRPRLAPAQGLHASPSHEDPPRATAHTHQGRVSAQKLTFVWCPRALGPEGPAHAQPALSAIRSSNWLRLA